MADLEYEVKNRIAYITLNRPEKLNALTLPMFDDIVEVCHRFNNDASAWVAILSGKGRAFCTGIDLGEQKGQQINVDEVYLSIADIKKPIIAALHGYCLAQGAGLAFSCDIRVATEDTKFGWPQVTRGIISISGSCLLPHHIPLNFAYEYLFTGELFGTDVANRFSLINRVVPPNQHVSVAEEIANKILQNAPIAVQGMKEATAMGLEMPLKGRLRCAQLIQSRVKRSKDYYEGIRAFAEKRKPVWTGE
jgi:enoyl-CoA hydratase/carnithine racemase